MTLTQRQAWLDQEDRETALMIRRYGCYIQYVYGDEPGSFPFAYSIGLFGLGHPEVVIAGVEPNDAGHVINGVFALVKGGRDLMPGEVLALRDWTRRLLVEVLPNPDEVLLAANRYYQRPPAASVEAYQLTWADRRGRFPGERDSSAGERQPRPGTFTA